MSVRVLAGATAGAALAGIAAAALFLREAEPAPPAAAPPPPVAAAHPEPALPGRAEPLPPAPYLPAERPRVPAGILARAASARALERGASCPQVHTPEPPVCPPEQRPSIDIEWHVAPSSP